MSSDQSSEDLYANTQARINTVVGEYSDDWQAIKLARQEWLAVQNQPNFPSFMVWLEDKYGIRTANVRFGNIDAGLNPKFEIVDESKYIIFLLKYK
jgi:hypothetical protein